MGSHPKTRICLGVFTPMLGLMLSEPNTFPLHFSARTRHRHLIGFVPGMPVMCLAQPRNQNRARSNNLLDLARLVVLLNDELPIARERF